MGSEKLTKVDSNETDVEKGQAESDDLSAQKLEKSTRHAHKVDFDTGEEHIRFRRHWYQIW